MNSYTAASVFVKDIFAKGYEQNLPYQSIIESAMKEIELKKRKPIDVMYICVSLLQYKRSNMKKYQKESVNQMIRNLFHTYEKQVTEKEKDDFFIDFRTTCDLSIDMLRPFYKRCLCGSILVKGRRDQTWTQNDKEYAIKHIPFDMCIERGYDCAGTLVSVGVLMKVSMIRQLMEKEEIPNTVDFREVEDFKFNG